MIRHMIAGADPVAGLPQENFVKRVFHEEILFSGVVLLLAGLGPNLFPAAQAGLVKFSVLGQYVLLPSVVAFAATVILTVRRGHERLTNRVVSGAVAGLAATVGLEIVRATGFRLGWMPGDLPRLMGVLLTDRFMLGPSLLSDVLGWSYHFWNGLCFGVIFTVMFGRRSLLWAVVYAQLIGIGFLLSPAVKSLGIGFMGLEMPSMPVTVVLAHLAYGMILGVVTRRLVRDEGWLLGTFFTDHSRDAR
ncbi:MAG: hypothetical protein BMS9Abin37_0156 [Acidobacteriota bacterium]|nr:MAG: hypothetical protein BMS9Abin37_0156 [Acidobacteriota bacterium]